MSEKSVPVVTNAYAIVPDETELLKVPVTATTVALDKPSHHSRIRDEYRNIPETRNLTWKDDFFEDDDDIVAVFDFDYDKMETYYSSVGWGCLGATLFFPNLLGLALIAGVPCFLGKNVSWNVRSQHIAVTRDGIRYVQDKRPTCWGFQCTDAGKRSKTVPFDKITDCDIVEPAGNTCLCIPNTLYSVHVDTASSDKGQHELNISGLEDPHGFKKLVWAMKRSCHPEAASLPAVMKMIGRGGRAGTDASHDDVATLLRDIRDELRQQNETLKTTLTNAPMMGPSAPSEVV